MISGVSSSGSDHISQMWQKLTKKADTDGDGNISSAEYKTAAQKSSDTDEASLDEIFAQLDADGDGSISESDFSSSMKEAFGPGGPGGAGGPPPMKPEEMFAEADSDEDGVVSTDELKTAMSKNGEVDEEKLDELISKLDDDEDGSITEDEFVSGMKKMHEEHEANRPKPESTSNAAQKFIDQLEKSEEYGSTGEARQKLLSSLFSITA